ncbi:unnamed protein product [Clonostachys chloroleuca]|uniref:Uncharacterized protein n=1 Tax=Clonostachys chloroleuca TaxID=1926264 RepID=A0AA35M1H5_9HYPO|nr:unnamed protein product [Clonostachys chloroleuca]
MASTASDADQQALSGPGASQDTVIVIDGHMLTSMVRDTGNQDLIKFASSDELALRFQLGLADRLSRTEVLGLIGAVLKLLYGDLY